MTKNLFGYDAGQAPYNRDLGTLSQVSDDFVNVAGTVVESTLKNSIIDEGVVRTTVGIYNTTPTLNFEFDKNPYLDSRISFARSSTGWVTNKLGALQNVGSNVPRFDYDPITKQCKGILIEESRTNSVLNSNTYFASGSPPRMTLSATTAPDLTETATKVTSTGAGGSSFYTSNGKSSIATLTANVPYTHSIWFKPLSTEYCPAVRLCVHNTGFTDNTTRYIDLNFTTLAASNASHSGITGGIIKHSNGWYRCYISFTPQNTVLNYAGYLFPILADGTYPSNIPAGVEVYSVWNTQVEQGSNMTSTIATTGSAATRSGDILALAPSYYFNEVGFTLYSEYILEGGPEIRAGTADTRRHIWFLGTSSPTAQLAVFVDSNTANPLLAQVYSATSGDNFVYSPEAPVFNAVQKVAATFAYDGTTNVFAITENKMDGLEMAGATWVRGTYGTSYIGGTGGTIRSLNGCMKKFQFYSVANSDIALEITRL